MFLLIASLPGLLSDFILFLNSVFLNNLCFLAYLTFNFNIYLVRSRFFLLYFLLTFLLDNLFLLFKFFLNEGFWDFRDPFRFFRSFSFLFRWLNFLFFLILDEFFSDDLLPFDFLSFRLFIESRSQSRLGLSYRSWLIHFILPLSDC